jgi:hypothetical protein
MENENEKEYMEKINEKTYAIYADSRAIYVHEYGD